MANKFSFGENQVLDVPVALSSKIDNKYYLALEIQGIFSAEELTIGPAELDGVQIFQYHSNRGNAYYPVDARTLKDINGATHVELIDGVWHLYHGWKGEHQDFLLNLKSVVFSLLQPHVDKAMIKLIEATNPTAYTRVKSVYDSLVKYREAVINSAVAESKKKHMGYYSQYKHQEVGHVHNHIKDALAAVKLAWATPTLREDWTRVSSVASALTAEMAVLHTPLTKAQIAAAEEAKKKKEEAVEAETTPTESQNEGS